MCKLSFLWRFYKNIYLKNSYNYRNWRFKFNNINLSFLVNNLINMNWLKLKNVKTMYKIYRLYRKAKLMDRSTWVLNVSKRTQEKATPHFILIDNTNTISFGKFGNMKKWKTYHLSTLNSPPYSLPYFMGIHSCLYLYIFLIN